MVEPKKRTGARREQRRGRNGHMELEGGGEGQNTAGDGVVGRSSKGRSIKESTNSVSTG